MSLSILALIFLAVPLAEIFLLLQVGDVIGAWPTIALVVLTAVLGAYLVRHQGFSTWQRVQHQMQQGTLPAVEMMEGVALMIAGALLLTPGFFTDAVGFVLLTPPLRRLLIHRLVSRGVINVRSATSGQPPGQHTGRTVDGEYRHIK